MVVILVPSHGSVEVMFAIARAPGGFSVIGSEVCSIVLTVR